MQEVKLKEEVEVVAEELVVEGAVMPPQPHKELRVVQEEVEVLSLVLELVVPEVKCPSCTTFKVKNRLLLMVCR